MFRLRGSDAMAFYFETPSSPYVTLKVMIYEPTNPGAAPGFEELKEFIRKRLSGWCDHGLAMRVIQTPLDMHHPIWVRDPNFSFDNHVHHIALPKPGGKKELCNFISRILSKPLDPERPLWDSWIAEGLEGGRMAWVMKVHHGLADGRLSAKHIANLHAPGTPPDIEGTFPEPITGPIPGKLSLTWMALVDLMKCYTVELPDYYRQIKRDRKKGKELSHAVKPAYGPFMAPDTFFNKLGGRYRTYSYETFSLTEFKRLSKIFDCTINTILLGVCSEAIKRYVAEFGALPETPFVCFVPVGLGDAEGAKVFLNTEIHNNRFSSVFVPLDHRIDDIQERLKSIAKASDIALEHLRSEAGTRLDSFLDYLPVSFFRFQNFVIRQFQKRGSPIANLCISNVPGPKEDLYACDGKLKLSELLSCGNLGDPSSLGITAWSYGDDLCVSCLFRNGVSPQPKKFMQHLVDAYNELRNEFLPADKDNVVKLNETKAHQARHQA